jgi:hypothetical protein
MSDERVETLVYRICWDSLDIDKLRTAIVDTLKDDEVDEDLTPEVWGDTEQITILRGIYSALTEKHIDVVRIRQIDQRTDRAERGPHFFNLAMIMYSAWSHRWREANGHADAPGIPIFCIDHT